MATIDDKNLFSKGLLVNLKMGDWAGRAKLSDDQLKDLPKEIVRGVYDLLAGEDKEALKDLVSFDNKTRNWVKGRTIPFPIDGVYFILGTNIEEVIQYLDERKVEREEIVNGLADRLEGGIKYFADKYPAYYKAAMAKGKYPTRQEFKKKFVFEFKFFQINLPDKNLSFISPELYKQEMNKFKNEIDVMKQEVINIIYTELLDKTNNLYKQCADGKPSQKTLNYLQRFFETVDTVYSDFIDRKDVWEMINKVRKSIEGVEAVDLRTEESLKMSFASDMKKVVKSIKILPDVQLKRAIDI